MLAGLLLALSLQAGDAPTERDYYRVDTLPVPAGTALEVSGIAFLPDERPIVCTRRGQVFLIEGAFAEDPSEASYTLFQEGLQEPLGLLVRDGWIYFAQRGELSRMRDADGDDFAEELETICDAWRVGGNYHEYNFGPRLDAEGNFWITTNRAFGDNPFGDHPWRGFALRITPEGEMLPTACGLRSPAGLEISPWGDVFYTDNQGEWCGASKLSHVEPGDFHGHPYGIESCKLPEWKFADPGQPPNGMLMPEVKAVIRASSCRLCGSPTASWDSRRLAWSGINRTVASDRSTDSSSSVTSFKARSCASSSRRSTDTGRARAFRGQQTCSAE